jgi:hypothetical protein
MEDTGVGERPPQASRSFVSRSRHAARAGAAAAGGAAKVGAAAVSGTAAVVHKFTRASGAGRTGLSNLLELSIASAIGDAFVVIALAGTLFFSSTAEQARGRAAFALIVTIAPYAILAPLIGPLLDRVRQGNKYILMGTLLARGLLCWGMAGAVQHNDALTLLPAALGVLVLQKAYSVTRSAVTPRLLPPKITLVSANSRFNLASLLATSLGAGVALGVDHVLGDHAGGSAWVLRVATVIYLAAVTLGLRLPDRVDELAAAGQADGKGDGDGQAAAGWASPARPAATGPAQPGQTRPYTVPGGFASPGGGGGPAHPGGGSGPAYPGRGSGPAHPGGGSGPAYPGGGNGPAYPETGGPGAGGNGRPGATGPAGYRDDGSQTVPSAAASGPARSRRPFAIPSLGPAVTEAMQANATIRLFYGFIISFLAFILRTEKFGHTSDKIALGGLAVAIAVGGLVGTGIGSALRARAPQLLMFVVLALSMLVTAACAVLFGLVAVLAVALAASIAQTLVKASLDSILQRNVAAETRSSAFAFSETVHQLALVIGGLIGLALSLTNSGLTGLTLAACGLALALCVLLQGRRRRILASHPLRSSG